MVSVPETSQIVENAVMKYQQYLKEVRQKLVREFAMRTGDQSLSERLGGRGFRGARYFILET